MATRPRSPKCTAAGKNTEKNEEENEGLADQDQAQVLLLVADERVHLPASMPLRHREALHEVQL